MIHSDDDSELERRAAAGDRQAFDLLHDRYYARISWFFTIFAPRKARAAVEETMAELFGSLAEVSDLSLAERAYRLARATEQRHASVPGAVRSTKSATAKVERAQAAVASTL